MIEKGLTNLVVDGIPVHFVTTSWLMEGKKPGDKVVVFIPDPERGEEYFHRVVGEFIAPGLVEIPEASYQAGGKKNE